MKKLLVILLLAVCHMAHADVLGEYSFEGTLDGRIPVRIAFWVNIDSIAVGEIYYPKAKNPAPILIVGSMFDNGFFHLNEYQSDGVITGSMSLIITDENHGDGPILKEGTWTNPRTEKELTFKRMEACAFPSELYNKYPYADPQHIGREYSYQRWNPNYKSMMGGHVSFRGAGKYKLHFHVSNVPQNIAEGRSEPGRPAELIPYTYNSFVYKNVNECGYGFRATFFNKFVVLQTITGWDTLHCFGSGVSFSGVYIMVKE